MFFQKEITWWGNIFFKGVLLCYKEILGITIFIFQCSVANRNSFLKGMTFLFVQYTVAKGKQRRADVYRDV